MIKTLVLTLMLKGICVGKAAKIFGLAVKIPVFIKKPLMNFITCIVVDAQVCRSSYIVRKY